MRLNESPLGSLKQAFAHHVVDELLLGSVAEGLRGVAAAVALVAAGEDEVAAHD